MKISVIEMFGCKVLNIITGISELTMLTLNSIKEFDDTEIQVQKAENIKTGSVISVNMKLTQGSVVFEANIESNDLLIVISSNKNIDKIIKYYINNFEPDNVKVVSYELGNNSESFNVETKFDEKVVIPIVADKPKKKTKKSTKKSSKRSKEENSEE